MMTTTKKPLTLTIFALAGFCTATLPRAASAHGDAMFKMMDSNGDGKISSEEHADGAKKMFEKMDANSDGKVTPAEMDTFHASMMDKMDKMEKSEKMEKHAGDKKGHKPGGDMSSTDKIKMLDTNGDGVLSASEHEAGSKMMFDKMDTDKSGFLTKAELEAGHAKMMNKAETK